MTARTEILSAFPALRPGHVLAAAAAVVSCAAVASLGNAPVLAIWMAIWIFAAVMSEGRSVQAWLMFLVGLIFFYPEFSSAFTSWTEKLVVQTTVLGAFVFWYAPHVLRAWAHQPAFALIAVFWIVWAVASYAPVAMSYFLLHQVSVPPPDGLRTLYTDSSAIFAALPILIAPLAFAVPIVALQGERDWSRLLRAIVVATAVVLVVSALEYVADGHAVPYDPSRLLHGTSRMTAFSFPVANGFARMLLMPVLFIAAAIVFAARSTGPASWAVFAGALIAVVMTQSRTAFGSIAAGFAVLAIMTLRRRRTVLLTAAACAAVVFAAVVLDVRSAFAAGSERLSLSSLLLRMELWQGVIAILREHPWFGAHPGGYTISLLQMGIPPWRVHGAHNLYLYLGAEWGIPMMIFGVALQILTAVYAWSAFRLRAIDPILKAAALGLLALTVTYAVHGVTETVPPVFLFFTAGLAAAVLRMAQRTA